MMLPCWMFLHRLPSPADEPPPVRRSRAMPRFLPLAAIGAIFALANSHGADAAPPIETAPIDAPPVAQAQNYRQAAPGLLTRTRFSTSQAGPIAVEIVDILVGPGQAAKIPRTGFAGLLEVQAGSPGLLVDGKTQAATPGSVVGINEGQSVEIDNTREDRPFVARLIKLSAPGN